MGWQQCYQPPQAKYWQGRSDLPTASCFFQIVQLLDLTQSITLLNDRPKYGLVGFGCDEGVKRNQGRTGAADGPAAIRQALAKLAIPSVPFICYDIGDIVCNDNDLEAAQAALGEVITFLLQHQITPLVLGGGHEVAYGHYQGIQKFYQNPFGIVNFDAHFDMRPLLPGNKGSSGTPFLQIAQASHEAQCTFQYYCIGIQPAGNISLLFDTAKQHQARVLLAEEIQLADKDKINFFIQQIISENKALYLTLCLDVFAAPYAPGVSAPQAMGLTPIQILPMIRQLAASGKVMSYDIAELSPALDIDQRTAKLAANFIYEIIRYHV